MIDDIDDEITLLDKIAIRKAGQPEGWRPYCYQAITGAVIVTGCMTRPKLRGPNKGELKFLTNDRQETVAVTREDMEEEQRILDEAARRASS